MGDLENRFAYPEYNNFFVVQSKIITLKPEFRNAEKRQEYHSSDHYKESGTLLCLPEGPKYTYERNEVDGYLRVDLGNVVSAHCNADKLTAECVYPLNNETFFKDIPEIDDLLSRLGKAFELGHVRKPELDRILPIIKNQRIAHVILNELCEKYHIKRDEKIKVHARKCPYGGPVPSMERFDYTVFCYVGQNTYRGGEPGPYMGQRIFWIEFPGWDYIHELVKEKCFKKT
ncbi:MAG: hypothetical protein QW666_03355 [Candidatus Woesearchaeota archaeon]